MSLDLHQNCKSRLVKKLTNLLPEIMVKNNMFILSTSVYQLHSLDEILPQSGKVRVDLEKYIGESPFFEFVIGYLSQQLFDNQKYESDALPKQLIDLEPYSKPEKVAQEMVEEFSSLPWEYTISLKIENEFGKLFSENIKNYQLSDSVSIISPSEEFINQYNLKDKNEKVVEYSGLLNPLQSLFLPVKVEWDINSTYINFIISGFIDHYGTTATYENVLLLLKAFFGLGLSFRLFRLKYEYQSVPHRIKILVNRKTDTKWILENTFDLDNKLSETIFDLAIDALDENMDSKEKKIQLILIALNEMKFVFSNLKKTKKVISASQWYFESFLNTNKLLSFIQLTIVLEILLGDKAVTDIIGLGELLGNRCAYLIGTSAVQRQKILKEFKEIYRIRSRIVHSGERKLNYYERRLFNTLIWMCRRVIFKEIQLMKKDE